MRIITKHPIAEDSNDHIIPHGATHDFSDATKFCEFVKKNWPTKDSLLDLGTGTGTVVQSAIKTGIDAYGVEGSDAPRTQRLGAWPELADTHLFNADIRYEFELRAAQTLDTTPFLFSIITAWDVLEHMTEETIDTVIHNIKKHSISGTFVIATIQFDDYNNELYHHLLKPRKWWLQKFEGFGFKNCGDSPMVNMVRGVSKENRFWFERI